MGEVEGKGPGWLGNWYEREVHSHENTALVGELVNGMKVTGNADPMACSRRNSSQLSGRFEGCKVRSR